MKSKTVAPGRVRVAKNISLSPLQNKAVTDELSSRKSREPNATYSDVIQFAVEACYMKSASGPEGRAAAYLDARDRALEFEQDCSDALEGAGIKVERNVAVNGSGHRVDILASRGKKHCIVELKSSGRRSRLELVLGQAILLSSQAKIPTVVCVPYLTDPDTAGAFGLAGVGLSTPETLVPLVRTALDR